MVVQRCTLLLKNMLICITKSVKVAEFVGIMYGMLFALVENSSFQKPTWQENLKHVCISRRDKACKLKD